MMLESHRMRLPYYTCVKRGHPRQCRGSGVRSLIGSKTDSWGIWPGAPEISYLWPNVGPLSYSILGPHTLRMSTACFLMLDPTWPVLPYCPPLTQPPPVPLYLSPPFIELSLATQPPSIVVFYIKLKRSARRIRIRFPNKIRGRNSRETR